MAVFYTSLLIRWDLRRKGRCLLTPNPNNLQCKLASPNLDLILTQE